MSAKGILVQTKEYSLYKPGPSSSEDERVYWVMVYSADDNIASPGLLTSPSPTSAQAHVRSDEYGRYILMAVPVGRQHNFSVEAKHIGRVTMSVAVVDMDGDKGLQQVSDGNFYIHVHLY